MVRIVNGVIVPDGDVEAQQQQQQPQQQSSARSALASAASAVSDAAQGTGTLTVFGRAVPSWAVALCALLVFLVLGFRGLLIAVAVALAVLLFQRYRQAAAANGGGGGFWLPPQSPQQQSQQPQPLGARLGGVRTISDLPQSQQPRG